MLKKVVAALLAAAALTPAMAQENDGRDAGISRRGEVARVREQRGEDRQRPQFQRPAEAQQAPAFRPQQQQRQPDQVRPAPQPQVQARPQGQPGWRGNGNGNGNGGGRGNMFAERAQRQQAEAQAQGQNRANGPDRQRSFGNGNQQGNWGRNDGNRTAPFTANRGRADLGRGFDNRRFGAPNANWNGRNDWSRGWRDDNRFDWGRYRNQNRNLFRLPRYYAPYSWSYGYRRFSVGATLSQLLWSQDYWIDDPWYYHLPPAYGPYRWVRYYNDALLVDIDSGEVIDTVYDIFY